MRQKIIYNSDNIKIVIINTTSLLMFLGSYTGLSAPAHSKHQLTARTLNEHIAMMNNMQMCGCNHQ